MFITIIVHWYVQPNVQIKVFSDQCSGTWEVKFCGKSRIVYQQWN